MVRNDGRWSTAMIKVVAFLLVNLTTDFRTQLFPLFRHALAGKHPVLFISVLFLWAVVSPLFSFSDAVVQAAPAPLDPVTIQLRWVHQFQFAGYYAAIDKGYYADEGLQVSLRESEPGKDRIAPVLDGRAQYGVGDPSLLKLRMQGTPVVVLAQIFQHSPSVLIARRESDIFSADELVGKRVMLPFDDIGSTAIQAMILQGVGDLNRITLVPHTYNQEKFINGDVDAMSGYLSNEPFQLKAKGVAVNIIEPRSYGIDLYGDNLFTTDYEIAEHPERVRKMVRATIKGWVYTLEHKDEIIDLILTKYNPGLNREQLRYEAKVTDQMIVPDLVPIGEINPKRYRRIAETYHRLDISETSTVPDGFIYKAEPAPAVSLTTQERAWLKAHPVITLGSPIIPPWNFLDERTGQYTGIVPDYLDLIGGKLGITLKNIADDYGKIHQMAREKKIDGIGVAGKTAEREAFLNFAEPYITLQYSIVTPKESAPVATFADLAHKRAGILENSAAYAYLKKNHPDISLVTFKAYDAGLLAVLNGEIDAWIGSLAGVVYAISEKGLFGLRMAVVPFEMSKEMGVGIRKDWPESITILNKAIASIDQKEHSRIRGKWLDYSLESQKEKQVDLSPEEQAWLRAHPDIRLGYTDGFEPEVIVHPDGTHSGMLVDFLDKLNQRLGTRIDLHIDSIPGILQKAKTKAVDGILNLHPEYADRLGLSKSTGYLTAYPAIFARRHVSFEGPSDFTGKTVAIIDQVYFAEKMVRQYGDQATILKVKDALQGLQLVSRGDADLFIGVNFNSYLLAKYQLFDIVTKYTFFDLPGTFGMAVRPDWPELVSILNKGIASIPKHEVDAIVARWIHLPQPIKPIRLTQEERSWLKAHPDIVLGIDGSWDPLVRVGPDGKLTGIEVDMLGLLNRILGANIRLKTGAWADMVKQAKAHEIDGLAGSIETAERRRHFVFSDIYARYYKHVYVRTDSGFDVGGLEDLAGRKVAIQKSNAIVSEMVARIGNVEVFERPNEVECIGLLLEGKVDAVIGSVASSQLATVGHFGVRLAHVIKEPHIRMVYSIRRDWPEFAGIVNKGLAAIDEQEKTRIFNKYMGEFPKAPGETTLNLTAEERAWLKKHPEITIAYPGDYGPYSFQNQQGPFEGISVDLVNEIARRAGLKLRTYPDGNWTNLYLAAQKREIDAIGGIIKRPERDQWFEFTQPYLSTSQYIVTRKEQTGIQHRQDIAGKTLALVRGYATTQTLLEEFPTVKPHYVDSVEAAFEAVSLGKADASLGVMGAVQHFIARKGIQNLRLAALFSEKITDWRISVRKDWPLLRSILDKALASISYDERQQIFLRWTTIDVAKAEAVQSVKDNLEFTDQEQAWLAKEHTVQVRVVNIPPYIILKKGAEPGGISIDYLKIISERTGVKFNYNFSGKTFPEALDGLRRHQGPDLISSTMRTPEREKSILFSEDYISSPYVVFTHADTREIISDINDLLGKTIALPKGTVIHEKVKSAHPDFNLILFDNDALAIEAVASQKADAYIGNLTLASFLILEKGLVNMKIAGPSPFGDHVFSMGIRNDWPELTSIVNKALATISPDEHARIRNKYISVRYEHSEIAVIVKWALIIGGIASGIVFLFVYWNRTLAKKVRERTVELESSNQALAVEVAERVKVEAALRENRDYLENLTSSLADAVFSVKLPERIIEWTKDSFGVLGYEDAECIGRTTEFMYPGMDAFLEMGEIMSRAMAQGKDVLHTELLLRKKDGQVFPADITISFFRNEGKVVSMTGIVRDIVERKQREQQLQAYQKRLKALASQLTITEERERRRMAADLHDHIGQTLALTRMQLAAAQKSAPDETLKAQLGDISQALLKAVQDTRHIIYDLSAHQMNEVGLAAALSEWMTEQIEKRHGLETELIVDGQKKRLDDDIRAVLFRNIRELMTNSVKHARATRVTAHIQFKPAEIKMIIRDNGVGFDADVHLEKTKCPDSFGLFSIQERMADMGGTFEIESAPGIGTTAVLTVPVGEGKGLTSNEEDGRGVMG